MFPRDRCTERISHLIASWSELSYTPLAQLGLNIFIEKRKSKGANNPENVSIGVT